MYIFVFLVYNVSAKTTLHGPIQYLIHHHSIPHTIVSDQGTQFTTKEVLEWAHAHEIH